MAEVGGHGGTWYPGELRGLAVALAGKALAMGNGEGAALCGSALRAARNTPKWGKDYCSEPITGEKKTPTTLQNTIPKVSHSISFKDEKRGEKGEGNLLLKNFKPARLLFKLRNGKTF